MRAMFNGGLSSFGRRSRRCGRSVGVGHEDLGYAERGVLTVKGKVSIL